MSDEYYNLLWVLLALIFLMMLELFEIKKILKKVVK